MDINKRILYIVNVDWFFISHRMPIALEAQKRGFHVSIATTDTGRLKELENLNFTIYKIKINRGGLNPFIEFLTILRIIKIIRKVKPTIIHNVTLKISLYGSFASLFAKSAKVINAISGLGYTFSLNNTFSLSKIGILRRYIFILMKFAFHRRGLHFIFQNPDDQNIFKKIQLNNHNYFYLIKGSGVDLGTFNSIRNREIEDEIVFILTARMLKDKGISEYINASKIVCERYSYSKYLLVGNIDKDNPASYSEEELHNQLMGTKVQWLGHREDVPALLQLADVMVFPSYREGLPKSLMEAAAAGLPIITTNTIGCKECVDEGVNGYLVPVGDSIILAEKMIAFIQNPELIIKMGKASRIKAENEFSLNSVIDKTFEIYD